MTTDARHLAALERIADALERIAQTERAQPRKPAERRRVERNRATALQLVQPTELDRAAARKALSRHRDRR